MPDVDPPNLGEVLRRLDDLRSDVADLIAEMKADRAENARIYVRADVYNVAQTAQNAIVADLHRDVGNVDTQMRARIDAVKADVNARFQAVENERKEDVRWRRQASLTVGIALFTALVSIGIAAFNLLAR